MENFKFFNASEIFSEFNDKAAKLIYTEKVFYEKIINQIMDLIVYKFTSLVIREADYDRGSFLGDLQAKIQEIKNWVKLKSSQLNLALTRGKANLEDVFQANRKDTFVMGAAKKSSILLNGSVDLRGADERAGDVLEGRTLSFPQAAALPG